MTNTKKAGENANSRTLVGTMVGITAAIAAQRIAEVGALQNKKKQMERDAVIIAETFLDTKLPESVDIIKQYISKKTSLEIADDANAAQVISALFYNEIESAQKEQMRLVNEIIDESSKNFGHNFSAEIKAQKFIEAINGWDEAEYKHKHLQANVTAEKDYQDLRAEARQSLIAAGILDKDGRISKEYCSKFKTPLKERITEEIPVIENKKSQTRKTRVVDVEKKNVLEGVIEEEKIELNTENMESSLIDETQIPIIKEVVVKEASTRKTHVRETVASNIDCDDTKEKTTTNKKPTTRKTQPKHQRQPVDDVLKTTNDESVDNKADENKDDTKKVEAKNK